MTAEENDTAVEVSENDIGASSGVRKNISATQISLILFCLVSLTAVLVSGFVYYDLVQLKNNYASTQITPQADRLDELQKLIDALRADNGRLSRNLDALVAEQESILAGQASAGRQATPDNLEWLLAEVENLLIIASQRLALDQNVSVALAALQSADTRLRDFNDSRLLQLRRQITTDINALQAVNAVDISGLALYLLDIAKRVNKLPLQPLTASLPDTGAAIADSEDNVAEPSIWRRLGDAMGDTLKDFVKVYREGEGGAIAMLPEQRNFLHQTLQLQLETATRAVLQRETHNFRSAVIITQDHLRENFDTQDAQVDNIIVSLNRMAEIELQPALPDIDSSLESLRAIRHESPDAAPAALEGPDQPAP